MLSKVLAGVFAVAVLTVGGYAYWQYTDGAPCCGTRAAAEQSTSDTPPCCQEPSRASCPFAATDAPACCDESSPAVAAEALAIQPREVK
jgi:hypothetical protein